MPPVEIQAVGCYLPAVRLSADAIRAATGSAPRGLRSKPVADPDEDALTMAIEAGRRAMDALPAGDEMAGSIGSLALASQSLPYVRRVQAGVLVESLGLAPGTAVSEHTTSDRAAIEGLVAVSGAWSWMPGERGRALLIAADGPTGPVGALESAARIAMGAGATALVLGSGGSDDGEPGVASIDALASAVSEDPGLSFTRRGQQTIRDVEVSGYAEAARARVASTALDAALERAGISRDDLRHVALGTRDARVTRKLAGGLGLRGEQWREIQPFGVVGDQGANGPLISLVAALDRAAPGDRLALVAMGEGSAADAVVLTAGPRAAGDRLKRALEGGRDIDYVDYLRTTGGR